MRCYHLSNMYLSSIQNGIQSAHTQMELFVKYIPVDEDHFPVNNYNPTITYEDFIKKTNILYEWAGLHKTMIVLNGGFLSDMEEALEFLNKDENPYPFAEFYESEETMGGMLTNIAIILPEKIYKTAEFMRKKWIDSNLNTDLKLSISIVDVVEETLAGFGEFSTYELELCTFINQFRMAS